MAQFNPYCLRDNLYLKFRISVNKVTIIAINVTNKRAFYKKQQQAMPLYFFKTNLRNKIPADMTSAGI
ncbi:hypothetical protein D7V32_09880 [Acinetobacter tianfuensis]|uniref:Uncharacterized protein n=1 Tax=Acinetobacter tianfuensis TaxID=2419603 RepID=A0A3A8E824_9GAMM|nr:hypothetical protein D7V32_09880 [Acinetobacter tianfuensis]